jgi:hypothetical protein
MATLVGFDAFLHEPSQAGPERFQINMTPPLASEQRDRYRRLLLRPGGVAAPASLGPGSSDPVRLTSYDGTGPVQVEIPVEMPSPETGKGRIKGRLVLQLNQPELQSELRSLFSGEDWAKQPLMDPGGSAVIEKLERPWRVVAIESAGEPVPQAPGPGGPDGPPEGFPGMPH